MRWHPKRSVSRQKPSGQWGSQSVKLQLVELGAASGDAGGVPDGESYPGNPAIPGAALALPVYDNNGKSAGLALVSLVPGPEGRMTQGDTRMIATEQARGAVLQRSQSGNTIVVSDLTAALDAVRNHPKDGVVLQTSDEAPSSCCSGSAVVFRRIPFQKAN